MPKKDGYVQLVPQGLLQLIGPLKDWYGNNGRTEYDLTFLMRNRGIKVHKIEFNITRRPYGPLRCQQAWPCPKDILMATVYYELSEEMCKSANIYVSKDKYTEIVPAIDVKFISW